MDNITFLNNDNKKYYYYYLLFFYFLIHIDDLSEGLNKSYPKLFTYNTSLFSVVIETSLSQNVLSEELAKINNWHINISLSSNDGATFVVFANCY